MKNKTYITKNFLVEQAALAEKLRRDYVHSQAVSPSDDSVPEWSIDWFHLAAQKLVAEHERNRGK